MRRLIKIILFFVFLASAKPLYSQLDIERATHETDRLSREQIQEKLLGTLPQKPAEEAETKPISIKKEGQKFFIKKINLTGCESFSPQDFSSIIEKYENKEITLEDLDALANEIEAEYLRRGVIAACFVPAQEIKDQAIILQLVEARMGDLQIQEHKYFKKKRLNYYWRIPRGEILQYGEISKSIQLMNKNPDREVKAALHAGKKPGTTDVLLTPETHFPVHFTSTFDNAGSPTTGTSRWSVGMRDNNFLGIDDTFLSGYNFGREFSALYAYHNLPLGYNGTSLLYGYSQSKATPKKEFASSGLRAKVKSVSVSLNQDLFEKDKYKGEVFLAFDAKDKTIKEDTGVTNRDRLRIISMGGNFVERGFGSTTTFSPELSQGMYDFGASPKDNPFASRGARAKFTKFNLGIQHKRVLPLNLQAGLKFKSQYASTKLTPQEEFNLGGIDSVRGYPESDYLADNGASASIELLIPSLFIPRGLRLPYAGESLREQTTSLVFVDYGWGQRRGALPTEKKEVNLLGIGAGLRFKLFDQALLRLEWGFPLAGNRTITETGLSRFHFSVDFQDKLPEEIERIRKIMEEENIKQWAWQLVNEELARPESPIREKLYNYLSLAMATHQAGWLKESKGIYERIAQIGRSLYQQAQDYVRSCIAQEKELKENNKLALGYYKEGRFTEAKNLWQKIIDDARPKPLSLEF